jgi:hypothetical protein
VASPHKVRTGVLHGYASSESLPWRFEGSRVQGSPDRIKVLLTPHDARRAGAPLAQLGLLTELCKRPDFERWVLLNSGGPLESDFFCLDNGVHLSLFECCEQRPSPSHAQKI